jgi:hypothetical protein
MKQPTSSKKISQNLKQTPPSSLFDINHLFGNPTQTITFKFRDPYPKERYRIIILFFELVRGF